MHEKEKANGRRCSEGGEIKKVGFDKSAEIDQGLRQHGQPGPGKNIDLF